MHSGTELLSETSTVGAARHSRGGWYLPVAIILLLVASFFRFHNLDTTPPGMHAEEMENAQLSDRLRGGEIAVIYDEPSPGREGLYYALLAASTTITGRGLILWRLPSVWMALLSLAVTTHLMRRLFGVRIALFTLGLMAVTFWSVWMGRSIQHVALLPLVVSGTLYLLTRAFQARSITVSSLWFTLGGLALGLAQYVHVTAWTLLLLALLFIVYEWITNRHELERQQSNIMYAFALVAIVCLPLAIFLLRHPGVREPVPITEQPGLITEVPERLISSVAALALRGDMLPEHNLPGRPVLGPILAALTLLGIGVSLAKWRHPSFGLLILWLVVGLLPTAFLPQKPDFEFMAVIMPVLFVFPAIGLHGLFSLMRQRNEQLRQNGTLTTLFGIIAASLIGVTAISTFRDYFLIWPTLGDVRLNYHADLGVLAHYLDTSDDPTPVSICSTPVDTRQDPFALTNAELLQMLMHRNDLPIRYFDCSQSLVIANGGESQRLIFPRSHYYDQLPGPLLKWMQYAHDESVPGIRPDVVMRLEASEEIANQAGAFITTALTAWPPEANATGLTNVPVSFGYNVAFLGYRIRDPIVSPGDWVEITTYWRMDGPPPPDLTIFAHMLSNPVLIVAQDDSLGVQINTLQTRDIFLHHHLIQTPGGAASGPYTLSVGIYIPGTRERLPAFEDGQARADRLFLQNVTLER